MFSRLEQDPNSFWRNLRLLGLVLAGWLAVMPLQSVLAQAPAAGSDQITLNFKDADIDSVVGAFGHLLNRTFLIDPRVRGKVTLETPRPVSRAQAYQLLQSTLRLQGFAIVESGNISKILPEADAKLQSGPVSAGRNAGAAGGDQVVTQIFRLQYESASNLVPVLRPLISPNNTITAYPNNNSLVITDYAANLQRLARIITSLDSPSTNEVEVIPVKNTVASDIAMQVSRLIDDSVRGGQGAQVDPGQRVVVMADSRTNAIMIRATSLAKVNLAKSLISRLDQPSTSPGNINVVYLRNAEAVRLVQVLKSVITGDGGSGTASGLSNTTLTGGQPTAMGTTATNVPAGQGSTPGMTPLQSSTSTAGLQATTVSAGGAIIAADPATNSLIITAPEPLYRNLRQVIDRLDARRVQVHIESLIVEISSEKAAELGIQWQFGNLANGNNQVFGGTNLPARGTGTNILDIAANPNAAAQGLNIGVLRGVSTVTVNGVATSIFNLGVLARALESGSNANILATPNLLTLDNEEARIIIGQNVPFITGQFTTPASGSSANPFQTIERKDVGTTLRVKPQVSEAGTVKMQIFQEVSSVQDRTLSAGLITNRRAIESNVLVDDGQVVVLGGLIEERVETGEQKVPGLGDIPIIGQLFRYDARKRIKTNLLVFLRPVIVRDASAAHNVTADRYDYMRQLQGESRPPNHWLLPNFPPTEMPAMPAPPAVAPAPAAPGSSAPGSAPASNAGDAPAPVRAPGAAANGQPRSMSPDIDVSAAARRPVIAPGITIVPAQPPAAPPAAGAAPPPNSVVGRVIQTAPNEIVIPIKSAD